jgi:hypothetical protein
MCARRDAAGKAQVLPSWRGIAQRIRVAGSSDDVWGATPSALQGLIDELRSYSNGSALEDGDVELQMIQDFTRPAPLESKTIGLIRATPLSRASAGQLLGTCSARGGGGRGGMQAWVGLQVAGWLLRTAMRGFCG